jgi:hypothetical protein
LVEELKSTETTDEIRSFHTNSEIATIRVPVGEILSSSENSNPVRMASLLFRNMSELLRIPERLREETDIDRSAHDQKLIVM